MICASSRSRSWVSAAVPAKRALKQLAHLAGRLHLRGSLGNLLAQFVRRPAQVRLQNLADVHTRRHAQRVQDDLHRSAVGQVRHVLLGQDARDDALVAVASGHLVAHRQLALHGDVHLHHLDDARRKLVALLHLADLVVGDLAQHVDLARGHLLDLVDLLVHARVLVRVTNALQVARADQLDGVAVQDVALGEQLLVSALVVQVAEHLLRPKNSFQPLQPLVGKNADFVGQVAL